MRVAALDLGSNTTICLIADVEDGRVGRVVCDQTTVTRMGQGVHADRRFHPDALARVEAALANYAERIRAERCERVVAVATSAARDVANADELLAIGRKHGVPIHIIGGEREAELTYRGASGGLTLTRFDVIDVGGGSTEVIGTVDGVVRGVSVDVGSVRLSEMFITDHPIAPEQVKAVRTHARDAFAAAGLPPTGTGDLVAVAGTPVTLAMIDHGREFDERFVHGYRLTRARIEEWIDRLAPLSVFEREQLPGMPPKRADVIVCGAAILSAAMDVLGRRELIVSTRGVRYGVALGIGDFPC